MTILCYSKYYGVGRGCGCGRMVVVEWRKMYISTFKGPNLLFGLIWYIICISLHSAV
jgi:hypothetical protein